MRHDRCKLPRCAGASLPAAAAAAVARRVGGGRRLAQPAGQQPLGLVVGDQARFQQLPGTNSERGWLLAAGRNATQLWQHSAAAQSAWADGTHSSAPACRCRRCCPQGASLCPLEACCRGRSLRPEAATASPAWRHAQTTASTSPNARVRHGGEGWSPECDMRARTAPTLTACAGVSPWLGSLHLPVLAAHRETTFNLHMPPRASAMSACSLQLVPGQQQQAMLHGCSGRRGAAARCGDFCRPASAACACHWLEGMAWHGMAWHMQGHAGQLEP